MTLAEKIIYCRKKSGLSQDALAEKLNVSRQAVSKWETGESVPETKNLLALASALGTTVDWLLSPDAPEADTSTSFTQNGNWIDRLPCSLKNIFQKYGWLLGAYITITGIILCITGILAKRIFVNMYPSILWEDPAFKEMYANSPFILISNFARIIGIILVILGIVLAIILKRKHK